MGDRGIVIGCIVRRGAVIAPAMMGTDALCILMLAAVARLCEAVQAAAFKFLSLSLNQRNDLYQPFVMDMSSAILVAWSSDRALAEPLNN